MPKIVFTTSTIKIRNKVGPLPTPFVKISLYHKQQFILKYANAASKEQSILISANTRIYDILAQIGNILKQKTLKNI